MDTLRQSLNGDRVTGIDILHVGGHVPLGVRDTAAKWRRTSPRSRVRERRTVLNRLLACPETRAATGGPEEEFAASTSAASPSDQDQDQDQAQVQGRCRQDQTEKHQDRKPRTGSSQMQEVLSTDSATTRREPKKVAGKVEAAAHRFRRAIADEPPSPGWFHGGRAFRQAHRKCLSRHIERTVSAPPGRNGRAADRIIEPILAGSDEDNEVTDVATALLHAGRTTRSRQWAPKPKHVVKTIFSSAEEGT